MKLPNGHRAVVEEAKIRDCCLSPTHPRGRHKARLFAAALGITAIEAHLLCAAVLEAARDRDAQATRRNAFGQLYEVRFACTGPTATADVLSVWIVADQDQTPRLVTAYPV